MFIKVDGGLTYPFISTTVFKQGWVFSPTLFYLYVNKLPTIYDVSTEQCHSVYVGAKGKGISSQTNLHNVESSLVQARLIKELITQVL